MRVLLLSSMLLGCSTHATADAGCPAAGCTSDDECPPSEQCAFEIGSCSAIGKCMPRPPMGCNGQIEVCGCCGQMTAVGGCFYWEGYAAGPVAGLDAGVACFK